MAGEWILSLTEDGSDVYILRRDFNWKRDQDPTCSEDFKFEGRMIVSL